MGALSGLRVLELSAMGPVPFCGMLLGDQGADVLRVDPVVSRGNGLDFDESFDLRGRNKRSAMIDLKHPAGKAVFLELVRKADVLLEGFRPGVMERLGVGPADCLAVRPLLVYGRGTGWGQTGLLAHSAGHDINYIAMTGALSMIGASGGPPAPPLNLVGDYGGGALYLAFGVMCALNDVRTAGRGQVVDAAMVDGVTSLLTVFHGLRQGGRLEEQRGSNVLDGGAPYYTTYLTSDGGYMAVGAIEERFYRLFVEKLGLDPADLPARDAQRNWPVLRKIFADRFVKRSRAEWEAIYAGSDACVSPVLTLAEAASHPANTGRKQFEDFHGLHHPAPAPRLSAAPGSLRRPPARAGADTEAILRDWGVDDRAIAVGLADGALGQVGNSSYVGGTRHG